MVGGTRDDGAVVATLLPPRRRWLLVGRRRAWAARLARGEERAAVEMTRQYVIGELSLILEELQAAATNEAAVSEVACLRQEVERTLAAGAGPDSSACG